MIYAGLDLHKDFSVITMMNAQGKEVVREDKLPDNGGIDEFFQGFNELVTVAMEAAVICISLIISWKRTV